MNPGFLKSTQGKLAAAAVAASLVYAVFGSGGLVDLYSLSLERDGIVEFNRELARENRTLEKKVERLKTDTRYIGRIARSELGMIGTNEVIYRIEDPGPAQTPGG